MHLTDVLPKDAIQSIDDPSFAPSYFGDPSDELLVVEHAPDGSAVEPPRAYPVGLLNHHEIVNDVVGGRPIAVTWCPICWSAAVYDRTVDGRTLTFGVSGKLADDALVLYDRETGTEWQQTTGEAVAGELDGEALSVLSAPVRTWAQFSEQYPDGVVLQPPGLADSDDPHAVYEREPYERYVESDAFGLYGMRGTGRRRSWDRTDLDAKTTVLGVEHGGEAVGYPLSRVEAAGGLVADTVGDRRLLVVTTDDGAGVYEDPGFAFELRDGQLHADGTTWEPASGRSSDGRRLDRVPARQLFAFAWQDAHGPDSFYIP